MEQFDDRLTSIESRLSKIENRLSISSPASAAAKAANPTTVATETKPGNWLATVAVICFVLAAGFIIKLSIDSGWLTPFRQAGIAMLLGVSLIGAGLALMKSDREYASYLPAAGVISLYLTVFAACRYYSIISFETAIGLTFVVSGICVWLYGKIRHDVYPVTAAIGAYIAPAILGLNMQAIFSVYYFLCCSLAFASIAIWMRTRTLTLISAYLALAMTAAVGLDLSHDILITTALGLQFLIFAVGTYLYTYVRKATLTETEAWGFLPVLLVFYAAEYYFIEHIQQGLAPWISVGFAIVLVALYLSAERLFPKRLKNSQTVILAYSAIVGFHSIYLQLLPHDVRPWLFVVIIVAFTVASHKLAGSSRKNSLWIPGATLGAIGVIEYATIIDRLLHPTDPYWILIALVSLIGLWVAIVGSNKQFIQRNIVFLLTAAHVLAIITFYRLTTDIGSLAVSTSWLFYGVLVMLYAFACKNEEIAQSALAILGFAAAKALLYDAASAPTVVRIFCLLLTGVVLYGCGFLMRKTTSWKVAKSK